MPAPTELDLEYAVMPPLPQADWWQAEGEPSALPLRPDAGPFTANIDLPRRLGAQLAAPPAPQQQETTPMYTGAFPCAF